MSDSALEGTEISTSSPTEASRNYLNGLKSDGEAWDIDGISSTFPGQAVTKGMMDAIADIKD